jgi:hypothetical protein
MFREFFFSSSCCRRAFAWLGLLAIAAAAVGAAALNLMLNTWYGQFYNLAQRAAQQAILANQSGTNGTDALVLAVHDANVHELYRLLAYFFVLIMPFMVLDPLSKFIGGHYSLAWRMSLIESYLERWNTLDGGAASLEGASQRVHEDTQRFASALRTGVSASPPRLERYGRAEFAGSYSAPLERAAVSWVPPTASPAHTPLAPCSSSVLCCSHHPALRPHRRGLHSASAESRRPDPRARLAAPNSRWAARRRQLAVAHRRRHRRSRLRWRLRCGTSTRRPRGVRTLRASRATRAISRSPHDTRLALHTTRALHLARLHRTTRATRRVCWSE